MSAERVEEKKEKLWKAYEKLLEIAKEDGIITDDEQKILETAKTAIENFDEYVDEALEDGFVTVSEHTKLLKLQDRLLRDTESQALEDDHITEDEQLLIDLLKKTVRTL
jgi:hypothetical protein